ncbi:penicillin-binding protein activator [Gammaproteobacteria bacterium]
MNRNRYPYRVLAILFAVFIAGCATTPPESEQESTTGEEPGSTTTTTAPIERVFPIDLRTLVDHVVDALLESRAIGNHKPLIAVGEVKDKTNASLDVKEIGNQIKSRLINSEVVRITDDDGGNEINEDKNFRLRDNNRPPKFRFDKLKSKNYRLIAVIHDTPPKKYDMTEKYFRMTLSLLDTDSGELIWIEEKENVEHKPVINQPTTNKVTKKRKRS